jgi:AAA family ATP:ADP antiporter
MAAADPRFDAQAYIGSFYGDYQFWVNVVALLLQAFVASRLVKYQGLRGRAARAAADRARRLHRHRGRRSFALVRWIKTAENATDYSIMNTARQLLWLPTSTDEKYKAKQAIDAFFVRSGDVLSAAIVFVGTAVLHLSIARFALVNVALVVAWLAVALLVLRRHDALLERRRRRHDESIGRATRCLGATWPSKS